MIDRAAEWPAIRATSLAHGVDPLLIVAIRSQEAGRPGREFGVLAVHADSYAEQLAMCVKTIRRYVAEFGRNPYVVDQMANGVGRLAYSPAFITECARRYCPVGASNDPTGLNGNWQPAVEAMYRAFVRAGVDITADWPEALR